MKRATLLTLLFFTSLLTLGQYKKLPLDTNHYWHETFYYIQTTNSYNCDYQYNVVKDTIINTKTFHKISMTSKVCSPSFYSPLVLNPAFIRQDTVLKRVILYFNNQEQMLYNFNKNAGDTVNLFNGSSTSTFTVNTKDSILLNDGLYHRRFKYTSTFWVIEGVGGYAGLVSPFYTNSYMMGVGLKCMGTTYPTQSTIFHQSGNTYSCSIVLRDVEYSNPSAFLQIFPNPTNDQMKIKTGDNYKINSVNITNILGQNIQTFLNINSNETTLDISAFSSGVYFVAVQTDDGIVYRQISKH